MSVSRKSCYFFFIVSFFSLRNKIFAYLGIILSDNPAEGLMNLLFGLSLAVGSVAGLVIMGVIAAVKNSKA